MRRSGQPGLHALQTRLQVPLLGMAAVPERHFRNLVTFFHTLVLERNTALSDKDACTPAKSAGHPTSGLSFHCTLFTAMGTHQELEGLWVILLTATASSVGDLIKGSCSLSPLPSILPLALNINTASEASVLALL